VELHLALGKAIAAACRAAEFLPEHMVLSRAVTTQCGADTGFQCLQEVPHDASEVSDDRL
jgi:hypothetical protein